MIIHARSVSLVVVSVVLILTGWRAAGQEPAPAPAGEQGRQAESVAAPETSVILKEGTEVRLKLAQTLTSKTATVGEPVEFVVAEDVMVGEFVVARKGTRALGIVAEGKKTEKQRREARQLSMRFDHIKLGDATVTLRGEQSSAGKRNAGKMVAFTILFGVSGLLMSSDKKFVLPEGTPAIAYVDQDVELPVIAIVPAAAENPVAPEPGKGDSPGDAAP